MSVMKRILCFLLTLLLLIPGIVTASAANTDYTYENSLLVRVTVETQRAFTAADFPEFAAVQRILVTKKQQTSNGFTYTLMLVAPEATAEQTKAAESALMQNPLVESVNRNGFAPDYAEKHSSVSIGPKDLVIGVGEAVTLAIEEETFVLTGGSQLYGILFTADPAVYDPEQVTDQTFAEFGLTKVYGLTQPYSNLPQMETPMLDPETLGKGSPVHQYFAELYHSSVDHLSIMNALAADPGILSCNSEYVSLPTGYFGSHNWASKNTDLLSIFMADEWLSEGNTSGTHTDIEQVTLVAKAPGVATVEMTRDYHYGPTVAACDVTIYEPGDTDGDNKVTAYDALQVLRTIVCKHYISSGSVEFLRADMDRSERLTAEDAIYILQKVVSKGKEYQSVALNETNFPDPVLRQDLAKFDTDGDGIFSAAERREVRVLDLRKFSDHPTITDATGLNWFSNVVYLDLMGNELTWLDVSGLQNLYYLNLQYNSIKHLDLSQNTKLDTLNVKTNYMESLNITKCKNLRRLEAWYTAWDTIDLSGNPNLQVLSMPTGQTTTLDLSHNKKLTDLSVSGQKLTALDLSKNTLLTGISCGNNPLTALDVSVCPNLTTLQCYQTDLTALDVTRNPALTYLHCEDTEITALDVTQNPELYALYCGSTPIETLNLQQNPKLKLLDCTKTKITQLNLYYNPLVQVDCDPTVELQYTMP